MAMVLSNGSTIYGISNFTIGSTAISYKVDKYVEATDNLTVKIGSTTIATRNNVSGTNTGEFTRSITFSAAELSKIYNAMPKATKATFTFTITSYIDGANIGSTSATATGTLPSTLKPNLTAISLTEAVSGIASKFGGFVKNKSKLNYAYSITNAAGATTSSYNLTIDGATYTASKGATNILKNNGTLSYSAYVVDSRGRKSNTLTGTITVLDYANPQISEFKVIRCNAQGVEDNTGAYAKYTVNASISSVNNKNDKSIVIDFKKQNDSTWTVWKNYTAGYTLNETSAVKAISTEDAYHFRVTVKDYFTDANKIQALSSSFTLMDILADGTGLALGKVATESNTLDIGFTRTNLSRVSYVGGQEDPNEKNMYFPNPAESQYPHNSKVYGGNATSPVAIGMYDSNKALPIFQYFDGEDYRLKFGDDIILRWGNYDIEAILTKTFASLTGRIHYKEGLLIQWGTVSIAGGTGEPTSQEITFPISYDTIPFVVESLVSTVPGTTVLGSGHGSDSTTGTTIYVNRINAANTSIRWLAIGFKEVA